jgi:hypothetical protein
MSTVEPIQIAKISTNAAKTEMRMNLQGNSALAA